MMENRQNEALWAEVFTDAVLLCLALPAAFYLRFILIPGGIVTVGAMNYLLLALAYAPTQTLLLAALGLYSEENRRHGARRLWRIWLGCGLGIALLLSGLFLLHEEHFSRLAMGIAYLLEAGTLSLKRLAVRGVREPRRVLLLGGGAAARLWLAALDGAPEGDSVPLGYLADTDAERLTLPRLGVLTDLEEALERYVPDEAVCALDTAEAERIADVIAACEKAGVRLSIVPAYAGRLGTRSVLEDFCGLPLIRLRRLPLDSRGNAAMKRFADIVGAAVGLVLTAPLAAVCAVGVRFSSPGPVIFRQERLGKERKPFTMYKFRTMRLNDAQDTGWTETSDPRRTPFGALLRKFSLDELPQLWNVLRGDMSLVGPRPELPCHAERFREEIPLYMVKHQVRPGMTGWAQIHGLRGDTSIRRRVEMDLYYIEHWSPLLDLRILFSTVFLGKFISNER